MTYAYYQKLPLKAIRAVIILELAVEVWAISFTIWGVKVSWPITSSATLSLLITSYQLTASLGPTSLAITSYQPIASLVTTF